ncbi:alpha/beta fold hydrolase [Haloferula chungangensis]|uniref:Alpha/beta fold hydrolase n=1 Tax=Haloferula chungangensis TaxID=1048331 RepID=A0ABW2L5S0_9BACT
MRAFIILIGLALQCLAEFPALDERLSNYEYPYEVSLHKFEAQGQPVEMAYMDVTPETPNGQTVLLMHGKNFSGAYWKGTADLLRGQGYRVVIPDQIGFGKSSKPTDLQYSFQALAVHTKGLLDHLEIPSVMVVGHSMGGMLATRFALMFPDRTGKLVLVNPIGLEDWKKMVPYQPIDEAYEAELKKTPESVKEYMSKAYFDGKWDAAWDDLLAIQAGWAQGPAKEKMAMVGALTSDMVFTQPVLYEFSSLKVPTLLIIGNRDRTAIGKNRAEPKVAEKMGLYAQLGQKTAVTIPGSKLVEFKDVGHLPQVEEFAKYAKELTKFLAR